MIRTLMIALALGTSFTALSVVNAVAQTSNPTTDQTDKSEEDWRKSKKKRDASDIFEGILNTGSVGIGNNQYPQNPIDSLPEESRRHLMKERAKVIAESDPGSTPDTPYSPSEEAKADPELAQQEKEAWDVIMTDMKSSGSKGQGGSGPNKVAIAGQGGGESGNGSRPGSVMRGGSSQSVADIMAQIKGLKSGNGSGDGTRTAPAQAPTRNTPSGQSPLGGGSQGAVASGKRPDGEDTQGQNPQEGNAQNPGSQAGEPQGEANQGDAPGGQDPGSEGQDEAEAATQKQVQALSDAATKAQSELDALKEAEAKTVSEPVGPLERIKREREIQSSGTQTSASNYLKKVKPKD